MTSRCFQFSQPVRSDPTTLLDLLASYDRWNEIFPATIFKARLIESRDGRDRVEVLHAWHGPVINLVKRPSKGRMMIDEFKPGYRAKFDIKCAPTLDGCCLDARLQLELHGWRSAFIPLIGPYVRRQVRRFFLEPLKRAAERN